LLSLFSERKEPVKKSIIIMLQAKWRLKSALL